MVQGSEETPQKMCLPGQPPPPTKLTAFSCTFSRTICTPPTTTTNQLLNIGGVFTPFH